MAKIQPLANFIVVQPEKAQEKTPSGILLNQSAQEKPETAIVIAVGKDVKAVKQGDKVLYLEEYGKTKTVTIEKEEFVIINEKNIVATVK